MKKYIFIILFFICPALLYADTIYFKDGTSQEGTIIKENNKSVTIAVSQEGNKTQIYGFSTEKISRIEKKLPAKPVKAKEAEPAKAKKEKLAKSKPKEVKPQPQKIDKQALRKAKAEDAALLKTEKKISKKAAKPALKVAAKKDKGKEAKPSAKAMKKAQEAELRRIEKEKLAKSKPKEVKPQPQKIDKQALRKAKAEDAALLKTEKKISKKAAKPAQEAPSPVKAIESSPEEKDKGFKYKLAKRDERNLVEPRKMNRIEAIIVTPNTTTNEELELMFSDVLRKELASNKKLDALWVIAYVKEKYPDGLPKAYGIWAPPGGWYDFDNIFDKSQYKWNYRFLKSQDLFR